MTVKKGHTPLDYEAAFADINVAVSTNIEIMDTILNTLDQFNKSYQQLQAEMQKQTINAPKPIKKNIEKKSIFKKTRSSYMEIVPGTKLNELLDQIFAAIMDSGYLSMFTKGTEEFFIPKIAEIKNQYEKNVNNIKSTYGKSLETLKQHQKTYSEKLDTFYKNCQKLEELYDAQKVDKSEANVEAYENMVETVTQLHKQLDDCLEKYNSERWQFNEEADTSLVIWEEAEIARQKKLTNLISDFARVFLQISSEAKEFASGLRELIGKFDYQLDIPHLDTSVADSTDKFMKFVEYEAPKIPVDISEFIPTHEFFSDELGTYEDTLIKDFEGDITIKKGESVTVNYTEKDFYIVTVNSTGACAELPFEYLANQPMHGRSIWKVIKKYKMGDYPVEENTIVAVSEIKDYMAFCTLPTNKKGEIPLQNLERVN
ncbi:hypothetical protein TVAG_354930 [Trichomonas vaginalis G3]|uniref:SH3 domain containing protein n=1 Tax=Trichomonas vaginalis (strain ATCC PRA-98 / G3) TaxID=412133 RepID=A2EFX8_TRIV3|nr:BAR/IMD domain-like family [Trichomonas vaginalis G3]EAY08434.1 hypothetical protein TVAG_354930 [Trichomonas vaginalis G3]KAI5518134.1 BAR/IMD domain-like family [Trichomonas vaginalis G3]|eukprot:XP_001320657.1 hypothetical protein [Trichomonas vaginalis G3]